ncbi:hypothetical protein [Spirochaeta dissipatitropha]
MLIFRLFAPIVWPALAFHWIKASQHVQGRLEAGYIFWLTSFSLAVYVPLKFLVPIDYAGSALIFVYSLVDWLPVLLLPFAWTAVRSAIRKKSVHIPSLIWAQWLVLWAVSWIDALVFKGLWQPYQLFIYPLLLLFLGIIPPLMYVKVYTCWRFRHIIWLLFPALAFAAGGVQLLFRYQRWITGSVASLLLIGLVIVALILLQTGKSHSEVADELHVDTEEMV